MISSLMMLSEAFLKRAAALEITQRNEMTARYGLMLTEQDAIELVETRSSSLKDTGRVEFGAGVAGRLIEEFRDSPYIWQDNYVETLHELIEMFYYYKNETLDLVSDEDLVKFMKDRFDGKCQGSLELLKYRELERMARGIRYRRVPNLEGYR
jgi:hypothetical protein